MSHAWLTNGMKYEARKQRTEAARIRRRGTRLKPPYPAYCERLARLHEAAADIWDAALDEEDGEPTESVAYSSEHKNICDIPGCPCGARPVPGGGKEGA